MFHPIANGSCHTIQKLECWTPEPGYIWDYVANDGKGKWVYDGIHRRHQQFKECYWERDERWAKVAGWKAEQDRRQQKDPDFLHAELNKFIAECWRHRLGGYWFYNNDTPTYVTGIHWYYLSCYWMKRQYPDYRDFDRQFFYAWDYVDEDPLCAGLVYVTKRRLGKCFGKNTPIRMFDGSIKLVQDITEGELVMGNDSTPRTVQGVTAGREKMYRITPCRGVPFTCNESHILSLIWNGVTTHTVYGWEKNRVVNIPVKQYLGLKDWEKEHLVLYRAGWEAKAENQKHTIPPYILGAWLGDGCATMSLVITNPDEEILNEFRQYAGENGLSFECRGGIRYSLAKEHGRGSSCSIIEDGEQKTFDSIGEMREHLGLSSEFRPERSASFLEKYKYTQEGRSNVFRSEIKRLNLYDNKHIPTHYLIDGRENRLQLLAGLVDTDGHAVKLKDGSIGCYEITQKNQILANQIVELARSLGLYVSTTQKTAKMKRDDGSVYSCEVSRMNICGDIHLIPCRVARKKCEYRQRRVDVTRTGFKVEDIGEGEYFGFAVDGNHLFLLQDGTVVHNSFISGCIAVEKVTRVRQARGGLQSKTDPDAKKLFDRAIVSPYRRLPYFFQPVANLKAGSAPANALKFEKGRMDASIEEELGSSIDFQPSTELAYDGEELNIYISDEFGKTLKANVADRWDVVKMCLIDNTGKIVGKSIHITTVEKMEGGAGDDALRAATSLWKDSNPDNRDGNGQTTSWLYKFFMPAQYAGKTDRYGFCDVEAELQKIANTTEAITDQRKRAAYKRKMPTNERDAFSADASICAFSNIEGMENQRNDLNFMPARYETGNFAWKDGIPDTEVEWLPTPLGKFKVAWMPDEAHRNLRMKRFGEWHPGNTDMSAFGCDPFDHKVLTLEGQKTMSMGAIVGVKKPNVLAPSPIDEGPCVMYRNRPATPELLWEDAIMVSVFYGAQILIEDNKPGCVNHFQNRGYGGYLAWLPGRNKPGISNSSQTSGGGVNGQVASVTESYVFHHIDTCVFTEFIDEWFDFDVTDTKKFDLAMGFGFAKILQKLPGAGNQRPKSDKPPKIEDILPASFLGEGTRTMFGF
jgi:hypothetical protein